jgi:hypothetical protein
MDIIKVNKRYFFNFIFLPLFFSGKIPEVVGSTTSGVFHVYKEKARSFTGTRLAHYTFR